MKSQLIITEYKVRWSRLSDVLLFIFVGIWISVMLHVAKFVQGTFTEYCRENNDNGLADIVTNSITLSLSAFSTTIFGYLLKKHWKTRYEGYSAVIIAISSLLTLFLSLITLISAFLLFADPAWENRECVLMGAEGYIAGGLLPFCLNIFLALVLVIRKHCPVFIEKRVVSKTNVEV